MIYSKNKSMIRVTEERLSHIYSGHPEMDGMEPEIICTLEDPDIILAGDQGEKLACKMYDKTPVTFNKYLVAVYRDNDSEGFLITAYYSRKLSDRRLIIWKN